MPHAEKDRSSAQAPTSTLLGNSVWNLAGWVATTLAGLFLTPVLIRKLGPDLHGVLVLLTAIVAPLVVLDLGMSDATTKFVAEVLGGGFRDRADRFIRTTMVYSLVVGAVGAAIIAGFSKVLVVQVFRIDAVYRSEALSSLSWVAAMWFVGQSKQAFAGAVRGRQRYDIVNTLTFASQLGTTGASILAATLSGSLVRVLQAQVAVAALTSIAWLISALRLYPGLRLSLRVDRWALRKSLGFGVWQTLNNVGSIVAGQALRWLLGISLPVVSVSQYGVAFQAASYPYLVSYRVGEVLFPTVAELHGRREEGRAAALVLRYSWFASALGIAGLVALSVFAGEWLSWWVGPQYAAAGAGTARVLALASGVGALFAVPSSFLLGTGRVKWLALLSVSQGTLALVCALVLVPRLGLLGAGISYTVGTAAHITTLALAWKGIFSQWIGWREYFGATFAHLGVAIAFTVGSCFVKTLLSWSPHGPALVFATAACATVSLVLMWFVDRQMPGGRLRHPKIRSLSSLLGC